MVKCRVENSSIIFEYFLMKDSMRSKLSQLINGIMYDVGIPISFYAIKIFNILRLSVDMIWDKKLC